MSQMGYQSETAVIGVGAQDDAAELSHLRSIARQVRRDIVTSVHEAAGGHLGGPLSASDMLVALYFSAMRIRPEDPLWEERDRFVLSKGHSSIALYATMAARGYFGSSELSSFDQVDSRLQGHPDMTVLAGIDMSTGSLGQGISAAVGMALGAKLRGSTAIRIYCMVGDGECQEGQVWEAAFVANRYHLDNLIVLVDFNKRQQYGWQGADAKSRRSPFEADDLPAKWRAFGWDVQEIDGHDFRQIVDGLALARNRLGSGLPICIVAHTVKGKGVSFMETDFSWHARVPNQDELRAALEELDIGGRSDG